MKIGLNATCLNDRPSGAKQRFVGIYGELVKQMPDDEFIVFEPADCRVGNWFAGAPNVSVRRTPLPSEGRVRRFMAGIGYWSGALRKESLDLLEGFNLPLVTAPGARNVMTVHDVRGLRAANAGLLERQLYTKVLDSAVSRVDTIIAVSETVRQEILQVYPQAQVVVVHNGIDAAALTRVEDDVVERTRQSLGLPTDFLLAVGHFEPRKNYLRLIDALALLRDRGELKPLVIIGNDSGGRSLVEERIRVHGLQQSVTLLSGLSDLDVCCAYQMCNAFVFPSTYEGFGIPILEAMAAGRPTVLSDMPVFREITEGLGVYFMSQDVDSIADAIQLVVSSIETRDALVDYGHKRLQDFAFPRLAGKVKRVYESI